MKNIKAVIFDLDGTLLNTLEDLTDAVNVTMARFSYPPRTIAEVRSFVGNGVNRLIELCLPGGSSDPNFAAAVEEYRAYYAAHSLVKTAPYPGISEMLDALSAASLPCAVVSNKPQETTEKLCRELFPSVRFAVGENEAAGLRRKPAPDMAYRAADLLGVDPDECVFVGDSEVDLATAQNAGIDAVAVLWALRDRRLLEERGAKIFVSTPGELTRLLLCEKL